MFCYEKFHQQTSLLVKQLSHEKYEGSVCLDWNMVKHNLNGVHKVLSSSENRIQETPESVWQ